MKIPGNPKFSALAAVAAIACATAPAWAARLPVTAAVQPLPGQTGAGLAPGPSEGVRTGSAFLMPLVAASDAVATGGALAATPVDDIAFVKQAIESGRKEVASATDALPQLQNPELKRIAEMLISDHGSANERLSKIAEAKGWPVPGPTMSPAAPAGSTSRDFDATWTAEMIAGHERSAALYRAQAGGGADNDLRKYAREVLPTIERHLAQLRSLQK